MPAPKITVYFTPDIRETGRIPISNIEFDSSNRPVRGRYELSLKTPCLIDGSCVSLKSAIKSTATLNFKSVCFGEQAKYVFKVNDYFEIWDTRDPDDEFCYFRGVVNQVSSNYTGNARTFSLSLENAGGWLLGDNSVYYLGQLIITKGQTPNKFFNPIKLKYGWIGKDGKETTKGGKIAFTKVKSPNDLLETLVNQFGNERIKILKEEFYDNESSIKSVGHNVGKEITKQKIFIADKLSEMEGSILSIITKFEGRPFNEIFIIETTEQTKIFWRNTRIRDFNEKLCMGDTAGEPENLVLLYTDPKVQFIDPSSTGGYKSIKQYSGILTESINKSNDDVVNGIFIYPPALSSRTTVPTVVIAQTAYDQDNAKQILDLDSVIRNGYRPKKIDLPFIPDYLTQKEYSTLSKAKAKDTTEAIISTMGSYLAEHTGYAYAMNKNIQNSGNGADVFQNNLHVTVADDFKIVRSIKEPDFFINVHKVTWYFDSTEPKTVLEWDRGFEQNSYIPDGQKKDLLEIDP